MGSCIYSAAHRARQISDSDNINIVFARDVIRLLTNYRQLINTYWPTRNTNNQSKVCWTMIIAGILVN